jgi:S1-C subfamily serine protease
MKVYNVASGAEYTVDHYNYVNFKDDVAILTIKESSDVTLEIASQAPFEGDSVTVIANPKEHFGTVTTGIISALRRDVQGSMMQISHGSSGSPVIKNQNSSPTKVNFL